MRVLIIEDEKPAAERLQTLLHDYDPGIVVEGNAESIEEAVKYLSSKSHPDLLLADIHLSDGHCFDIFRQVNYTKPVIFTTAYDNYALDAFKFLSIDYILKPISKEALATALNKFKNLRQVQASQDPVLSTSTRGKGIFRERFIGKIGQRLFFIPAKDISFFNADNKIVFLVDKEGTKYSVDFTMEKLEQVLDPTNFFRVNRGYIVNHHAIDHVKPVAGNRIRLILQGGKQDDEIILSRDRLQQFKQWAGL